MGIKDNKNNKGQKIIRTIGAPRRLITITTIRTTRTIITITANLTNTNISIRTKNRNNKMEKAKLRTISTTRPIGTTRTIIPIWPIQKQYEQ